MRRTGFKFDAPLTDYDQGRETPVQRIKILLAALMTILLLIVILQNSEPVETRILFATVAMPRAALLAITGFFGFSIGLIAALWFSSRSPR